jgi:hypothetical protein
MLNCGRLWNSPEFRIAPRILRRLKLLREAAEEQVSLFGKTILAEVSPLETQSQGACH